MRTVETYGEPILAPANAGMRLSEVDLARIVVDLSKAEPNACPCCGGERHRRVADRDRYGFPLDYVVCDTCGLLFANPYYTSDAIDCFYRRHFAAVYERKGVDPAKMFHAERTRGRRVAQLLAQSAAQNGAKFTSCLDLGCSHGGFLAALPPSWLRVGYDYDEQLFELGRTRNLELRSIDSLPEENRKFDVVMANQVLEHTRDPIDFMVTMQKYLAPNGVIYLEVPGLRSPLVRHVDIRQLFKNAHRFLFQAETLAGCAWRAGLTPVYLDERVESIWVPKNRAPGVAASSVIGNPLGAAAATIEFLETRSRFPDWQRRIYRTIGLMRSLVGGITRRLRP